MHVYMLLIKTCCVCVVYILLAAISLRVVSYVYSSYACTSARVSLRVIYIVVRLMLYVLVSVVPTIFFGFYE